MSNAHAAERAVTQQNREHTLRIPEALAGVPFCAPQRMGQHFMERLYTGMTKLHTAYRWLESKRSEQIASKRLRVVEILSLGEKQRLSIVTVDGAQYLIGSSANGVQLLTRLDAAMQQSMPKDVSR